MCAMARHFAGAGSIEMSIVTLDGRRGRVGEGIAPVVHAFHSLRPLPGLSMVAPVGVARAIRDTKADVVHLHSGAWWKPAWAARLAGVSRVVFTEHGREHDDPPLAKWLDRRAAAVTDVVVAVSSRLQRYLASSVGIPPERICVIDNGVDTDLFCPGPSPEALRAELNIPPDAPVVGSLGRLEPVKAYHRLLEAVAGLPETGGGGPLPHIVVFGDGSARGELLSRASELGLSERVRFPGWALAAPVSHRLLDVFVLTSVSEGASVSLLEAMATGTAPLTMEAGANAELMGPELRDLVTPPGDVAVFQRRLGELLRSPERRREAGGRARRRVLDRYGQIGMVERYREVYEGKVPR